MKAEKSMRELLNATKPLMESHVPVEEGVFRQIPLLLRLIKQAIDSGELRAEDAEHVLTYFRNKAESPDKLPIPPGADSRHAAKRLADSVGDEDANSLANKLKQDYKNSTGDELAVDPACFQDLKSKVEFTSDSNSGALYLDCLGDQEISIYFDVKDWRGDDYEPYTSGGMYEPPSGGFFGDFGIADADIFFYNELTNEETPIVDQNLKDELIAQLNVALQDVWDNLGVEWQQGKVGHGFEESIVSEMPRAAKPKLNPADFKPLETMELDAAKERAKELLGATTTDDKKKTYLFRNIDGALDVKGVLSILYNSYLSGEGMASITSSYGNKFKKGEPLNSSIDFSVHEAEEDMLDDDELLSDLDSAANTYAVDSDDEVDDVGFKDASEDVSHLIADIDECQQTGMSNASKTYDISVLENMPPAVVKKIHAMVCGDDYATEACKPKHLEEGIDMDVVNNLKKLLG